MTRPVNRDDASERVSRELVGCVGCLKFVVVVALIVFVVALIVRHM